MTEQELEEIVMNRSLTWRPIPGPKDDPKATAYEAANGNFRIAVVGFREDNGHFAISGAITHEHRDVIVYLPIDLAYKAWRRASVNAAISGGKAP